MLAYSPTERMWLSFFSTRIAETAFPQDHNAEIEVVERKDAMRCGRLDVERTHCIGASSLSS